MGGAMWFIHPFIISLICFCCIRKISLYFGHKHEIVVLILVVASWLFGFCLIVHNIDLDFHSRIAFLIMPIIYAGYLSKKIWDYFPIKWYFALISVLIVIFVYKHTGTCVDLSSSKIIGPKWFLLVSFAGIYFNLYLAKLIQASKRVSSYIAYLGCISFHIMALHFIAFKFVNYAYVLFYKKPIYWVAKFPVANPSWWVIYVIAGLLLPVGFIAVWKIFKEKSRRIFKT